MGLSAVSITGYKKGFIGYINTPLPVFRQVYYINDVGDLYMNDDHIDFYIYWG